MREELAQMAPGGCPGDTTSRADRDSGRARAHVPPRLRHIRAGDAHTLVAQVHIIALTRARITRVHKPSRRFSAPTLFVSSKMSEFAFGARDVT